MRPGAAAWWSLLLIAGCGGGTTKVEPTAARPHHAVDHVEEEEPDDGLELQSTRGKEDPDDVQAGLEPHAEALQDCFLSQVGKQKWLGGRVELHWELTADGELTSTQVTSGDLGAWPVEQCLLAEARTIAFPKPHGGPAGFSVPLDFAGPKPAAWWDADMAASVLSRHTADLEGCAADAGTADPTDVSVTLYLGTRGAVQSVGFASPAAIDDAWAACAEQTVLGWQLSDPKGKVVKLGFVYRQGETPTDDADAEEEW